jgi:hypothetical protein
LRLLLHFKQQLQNNKLNATYQPTCQPEQLQSSAAA